MGCARGCFKIIFVHVGVLKQFNLYIWKNPTNSLISYLSNTINNDFDNSSILGVIWFSTLEARFDLSLAGY